MKIYRRQRLPLINTTLKNSKLELTKPERKKISGIRNLISTGRVHQLWQKVFSNILKIVDIMITRVKTKIGNVSKVP